MSVAELIVASLENKENEQRQERHLKCLYFLMVLRSFTLPLAIAMYLKYKELYPDELKDFYNNSDEKVCYGIT